MGALASPFASAFGSGFSFVPDVVGDGGTLLSLLNATPSGGLAGQLDQLIDPVTNDYVRTANGDWAETADSRTTVLLMLELELGASPFDPDDGTTLKETLRNGDPITPEDVRAETIRACDILQSAGILTDLSVSVRDRNGEVLRDQSGTLMVVTSWRDLASGSPVDLIFQPG